ncbi:hypothetical protein ACFWM1_17255 [Nocardia sp. NPDC058379]|uniref:hypothetical protein n=1 Tax=unclassified Nocardia TaxID=2637762 RepID=UPI003650EF78
MGSEPNTDTTSTVPSRRGTAAKKVTLSVATVSTAAAVAVLTAATATFGLLYWHARDELSGRDAAAQSSEHAKQIAMDYAVGAATVDYRNTQAWFTSLKKGTNAALSTKFDATAAQLEQIMVPLQWTSTAAPITAAVTSDSPGIYKVNAFLNVNSTNAQNPQGLRTTVTYAITVDENTGWQITDVGGLDGALPTK